MDQTARMARVKTVFRCGECGADSPKWAGQCAGCNEWNTLAEYTESALPVVAVERQAMPLTSVSPRVEGRLATGVDQLDVVLGGGVVPGSATVLGGEPGIGKSTLLLQTAGTMGSAGRTVLYVAAEESIEQVHERAVRLGAVCDGVLITDATDVATIASEIRRISPDVVVVDSIQTVADGSSTSAPGSVTQVRDCAQRLVREARRSGAALFLVGHVTKEGSLAGPRVLEHIVDTVLTFEGDRHHALRFLRASKHRFGSTRSLGVFEMGPSGLEGVTDPSRLFLADRVPGHSGSAVVPVIDGNRPMLVEVQALVVKSGLASPRRVAQGFDGRRLSLVLAVLERHAGVTLSDADVYVSVVGGVKVSEPGADLAVAMAVVSSVADVSVDSDMVVCGEIGLGGEIRQVSDVERRLNEAARLGFEAMIVPAKSPQVPAGVRVLRANTVWETLVSSGVLPGPG